MSCQTCQGEQVAPICIPIEDNKRYSNLAELIKKFDEFYDKETSPSSIDTKSLTSDKTLKEEQIIQLLIDTIIQLKNQINSLISSSNNNNNNMSTIKGICPDIDWSCVPINAGCDTNFCSQLQILINTFYKIKSNV